MTLIEDAIIDFMRKRAQEGKPSKNVFNASEAGLCPLRIYLERTTEIPEPIHLLRLQTRGTLMHIGLMEIIRRYNPIAETEVLFEREIEENVILRGKLDVLVNHTVEEFKTVTKLPDEPLKEHIAQVQTYMYLTSINNAFIVYYDVTTGKMKSFLVKRDENMINDIINKFLYVYECLMKETEPNYKVSPFCDYCKFKKLCPAFKNTKLFWE